MKDLETKIDQLLVHFGEDYRKLGVEMELLIILLGINLYIRISLLLLHT
jgi:hypothetical protein